jgi:hypothetical protein
MAGGQTRRRSDMEGGGGIRAVLHVLLHRSLFVNEMQERKYTYRNERFGNRGRFMGEYDW